LGFKTYDITKTIRLYAPKPDKRIKLGEPRQKRLQIKKLKARPHHERTLYRKIKQYDL
jgi:hypothetical protein